jgi:hypothetical protein
MVAVLLVGMGYLHYKHSTKMAKNWVDKMHRCRKQDFDILA